MLNLFLSKILLFPFCFVFWFIGLKNIHFACFVPCWMWWWWRCGSSWPPSPPRTPSSRRSWGTVPVGTHLWVPFTPHFRFRGFPLIYLKSRWTVPFCTWVRIWSVSTCNFAPSSKKFLIHSKLLIHFVDCIWGLYWIFFFIWKVLSLRYTWGKFR